jgi:RHS repeat-associated protein
MRQSNTLDSKRSFTASIESNTGQFINRQVLANQSGNELTPQTTELSSVENNCTIEQAQRVLGERLYELSNHLGNVLTVISDRKVGLDAWAYTAQVSGNYAIAVGSPNTFVQTTQGTYVQVNCSDGYVDYYTAEIISSREYSAYGAELPGYSYSASAYRYGFNGQEKETEITGSASHTSAEFWMYDSRLGRRWNVDPVDQSEFSDYACFNNNPILMNDFKGDEPEGGPGKNGTKEGEIYVEKYLPACKECNEYKYQTWIWHMGGVNGSEADWMSVSDYNEDVLKPMALEHNTSSLSSGYFDYKANLRNAGLEPNALLDDARSYFLANPTYDGWKSYIPVWGSYQQARLDVSVGKYGYATFNGIMAATDVFAIRTILKSVAKGVGINSIGLVSGCEFRTG